VVRAGARQRNGACLEPDPQCSASAHDRHFSVGYNAEYASTPTGSITLQRDFVIHRNEYEQSVPSRGIGGLECTIRINDNATFKHNAAGSTFASASSDAGW